MHPLRFPLLADENIHEEVVNYLRKKGLEIESMGTQLTWQYG